MSVFFYPYKWLEHSCWTCSAVFSSCLAPLWRSGQIFFGSEMKRGSSGEKWKVVLHQKDLRMTNNLLVSQQIAFLQKSSYKPFPWPVEKKQKKQTFFFLCTCWSVLFSLKWRGLQRQSGREEPFTPAACFQRRRANSRCWTGFRWWWIPLGLISVPPTIRCDKVLFAGQGGDIWRVLQVLSVQ